MSVLRRDYLADDLVVELDAARISGVVSVQARQSLEETQALLAIAQDQPRVLGVVGWVPLKSDQLASVLEQLSHQPLLKGVRHVVQDEVDDEFLLGDAFNRGIRQLADYDLTYDLLIFERQLLAAIRFVDRHPAQRIVLDHIAKPRIAASRFDDAWAKHIRELAQRDNVVCKFSGVVTEVRDPSWSVEIIRPYWQTALEAFGPSRLMFGSDWPVCLLRTSYQRWVETVAELASDLSASEQAAFWSQNAIEAYRLDAPPVDE